MSGIRGYIVDNNLRESENDRQALNNLGGAPIADDIALFVNNTNNRSILSIREDEYNSATDTIEIINTSQEEAITRSGVFTDGDRVQIIDFNGEIIQRAAFIINSDTERSFQVSLSQEGDVYSIPIPQNPSGNFVVDFVRDDTVTFENLRRLGIERSTIDIDSDDRDTTAVDVGNYAGEFSSIDDIISLSNFIAQDKYVSTRAKNTDQLLRTEGAVIIADPSDTILSEGIVDTSPGLYLSDPRSNPDNIEITRAFSSSSNPWQDDNQGTLSTQSIDVTAGNLILENGIDIEGISEVSSSGNVDSANFTHKVRITVDGVDYFLCLNG